MPNLVTVEFRGDTLFAVEADDGPFVAVKPICDRLGLAWGSQYNRLQRDPLLKEGIFVTEIPSPGGPQETVCLALRLINGWLFGIDVARVKPELREDVLAYKRECYETLADRFLGPRAAERPIRFGEPGQDTEYRRRLDTVSEARRLYGPARARLLYESLGLPEVPELPRDPRAEPLAVALEALARAEGTWTGTASALYVKLGETADPECLGQPRWPRDAQAIGMAVRRLAPILAQRGVRITRRHSGATLITLALIGG